MKEFEAHRSLMDASVNYSRQTDDGGMIETRYVRRLEDRFIVYLSSMTGCDKACRFCHLTQTGQTMSKPLTRQEIAEQARLVLASSPFSAGQTVHFNFMARGEPLANPNVDLFLFSRLSGIAEANGLKPKFKISTIMPIEAADRDWSLFAHRDLEIALYYSTYRLDQAWRKRWMPKAMQGSQAFEELARFQQQTGQRVVLHHALIAGENDSPAEAHAIFDAARAAGLIFDFNLVRYNPANDASREADRDAIDAYLGVVRERMGDAGRVKEVPRVGFDVAASCGMFLQAA